MSICSNFTTVPAFNQKVMENVENNDNNQKKLFIDLKYLSSECHGLALNCVKTVDEFRRHKN